MQKIILASQSPRRKQLLEWAEIDFSVEVSEADETHPEDLPVAAIPVFIAVNKAKAVQQKIKRDAIILAADTIVVLEGGRVQHYGSVAEVLQAMRQPAGGQVVSMQRTVQDAA